MAQARGDPRYRKKGMGLNCGMRRGGDAASYLSPQTGYGMHTSHLAEATRESLSAHPRGSGDPDSGAACKLSWIPAFQAV
jgi:hypothetical protein